MGEEELRIASSAVKPYYASAYFRVSWGSIAYSMTFDYEDPLGYYDFVVQREDLLESELERLRANMQSFLDSEDVRVNGEPVRPEVVLVDIGFRGHPARPYIVFFIEMSVGLVRGMNTYENSYEPDVFEYDYSAYWFFPKSFRVVEADIDGLQSLGRSFIVVKGSRGDRAGGFERIRFLAG